MGKKRILNAQQKQAHNISAKKYREKNKDKIRQYQDSLKVKQARHERHVKRAQMIREGKIVVSEEKRIRQREHAKAWLTKNKQKHNVEKIANKIPLADNCEFCGDSEKLVRHHPDYDYPTIFITCCQTCHQNAHVNGLKSFFNAESEQASPQGNNFGGYETWG